MQNRNKTANINVKKLQFIQMLTATWWVTHRKQQKSKKRWYNLGKVILPSNTSPNVNVLLSYIIFFLFLLFSMC